MDLTNLIQATTEAKSTNPTTKRSSPANDQGQENKPIEDKSHMFKRLVSHNPTTYNGPPDPKAFEDWI